jgi:hypothetical protein
MGAVNFNNRLAKISGEGYIGIINEYFCLMKSQNAQ